MLFLLFVGMIVVNLVVIDIEFGFVGYLVWGIGVMIGSFILVFYILNKMCGFF